MTPGTTSYPSPGAWPSTEATVPGTGQSTPSVTQVRGMVISVVVVVVVVVILRVQG